MHKIKEIGTALDLLDKYDGQLSKLGRKLGINRYIYQVLGEINKE